MSDRVCPHWVGYLLINPFRKIFENPDKILGPFVQEGMTVLEPGCGMGYFTLPLARMVGSKGRVVVLEIQPKMLRALERRARKAGLLDRIELRRIDADNLGIDDLAGEVDFSVAIHMVHEVPDQFFFFTETLKALKAGCKLLFIEPKGHVSKNQFEQSLVVAQKIGFESEPSTIKIGKRTALLAKPVVAGHP